MSRSRSRQFLTALALGGAATLALPLAAPAAGAAAWAPSGPLRLGTLRYDAPGTDTAGNASVNGEYATIVNTSANPVQLIGWTVRDAQNHVHRFGSLKLAGHGRIVLHTGKGTAGKPSAADRYQGRGWHVWNNDGDRAELRSADGVARDRCAWTSKGAGYTRC